MKKTISWLLCLLMLAGLSAMPAMAEDSGQDGRQETESVSAEAAEPPFAFYTSPEGGEGNLIEDDGEVCYYTLDQKAVWLIADDSLNDQELADISVHSYGETITLNWKNHAARIDLTAPGERSAYSVAASYQEWIYSFRITSDPKSGAVEYGGYLIGLANSDWIYDEDSMNSYTSDLTSQTDDYVALTPSLQVRVGDLNGNIVNSAAVSVTVNGMSIKTIYGDENSFSFASGSVVESTNDSSVIVYCRAGSKALGLIEANITIDGTQHATVSVAIEARRTGLKFYTSGEMDEPARVPANSTVCYYTLPTPGKLWLNGVDPDDLEICVDGETLVEERDYTVDENNVVEINIPEPEEVYGYNLDVFSGRDYSSIRIGKEPYGSCVQVNYGNDVYIVGFTFQTGSINGIESDIDIVNEGDWQYAQSTSEEHDPNNERVLFRDVKVDVGQRKYDESGEPYYEVEEDCPVKVKVLSMELRTLYGEGEDFADTFSFSADSDTALTSLSSVNDNNARIYFKQGYVGTALAVATVEVTAGGGEPTTGTVSVILTVERSEAIEPDVRGEDDTVEQLSAAIQEDVNAIAENMNATLTYVLTAKEYVGTIVLPQNLLDRGGRIEIRLESQNRTTIVGGINLNSSSALLDSLDFVAPEGGENTSALFGGRASPYGCTFQGYDVAIDASVSTINPEFCVFADNGVAARVNLPNPAMNINMDSWAGNVFINNGTAVQVLALNNYGPYYFRIIESNFVKNDVTFDVQCPGTIYLYRNYYGMSLLNASSADILKTIKGGHQLLNSVINWPPVVHVGDPLVTRVITNPRWIFPRFDDNSYYPDLPSTGSGRSASGSGGTQALDGTIEESDDNYLTVDWGLPTDIVNIESDSLIIDAKAFLEPTQSDRIINLVDREGNTLATWNLGMDAHPGITGGFDAKVEVDRGADGEIKVTISADKSILAELRPTLKIPNASGGVQQGETPVASVTEGTGDETSVSFEVTGESGGDYVISPDTPVTEPNEPAAPDNPGTAVKPGTTDDVDGTETPVENAFPFADVAPEAWYYDAVVYVYKNGLMDGVSGTQFNPDGAMTRAMVWAILARIDGETITGSDWIADARNWAVASGVSDGTNADGNVTRQELVTMFWRYAGEPAADAALSAWRDAASIADWAEEAMAWAVENGVITGVSATAIDPLGSAPRAQCAAILMRSADSI